MGSIFTKNRFRKNVCAFTSNEEVVAQTDVYFKLFAINEREGNKIHDANQKTREHE